MKWYRTGWLERLDRDVLRCTCGRKLTWSNCLQPHDFSVKRISDTYLFDPWSARNMSIWAAAGTFSFQAYKRHLAEFEAKKYANIKSTAQSGGSGPVQKGDSR